MRSYGESAETTADFMDVTNGSWLASDPEALQSGVDSARPVIPAGAGSRPTTLLNHLYPRYPCNPWLSHFDARDAPKGLPDAATLIRVAIGTLHLDSLSSAISKRVGVGGAIIRSIWICHAGRRGDSCRIGNLTCRGRHARAGG